MTTVPGRDGRRVREMFEAITPRYDLLNHLLSFGFDYRWRARAALALPEDRSATVLDLCAGTGDLAIALIRRDRAALVVACDFALPMLARGVRKFSRTGLESRIASIAGDAMELPFRDNAFDAVAIAFGVRNFENLARGLREMLRVLRPGGRLVILEFSRPPSAVLSWLHRTYVGRILPRVGDAISGNRGPYGYLSHSIGEFPDPETLARRIREAGFGTVRWTPLSGGIVCIHTAIKGTS